MSSPISSFIFQSISGSCSINSSISVFSERLIICSSRFSISRCDDITAHWYISFVIIPCARDLARLTCSNCMDSSRMLFLLCSSSKDKVLSFVTSVASGNELMASISILEDFSHSSSYIASFVSFAIVSKKTSNSPVSNAFILRSWNSSFVHSYHNSLHLA